MVSRYYAGMGLLVIIAALFMWAEENAKRSAGARWFRDV